MSNPEGLVPVKNDLEAILRNASSVWADSTTRQTSLRRGDLLRDKVAAVSDFFAFAGKHPGGCHRRVLMAASVIRHYRRCLLKNSRVRVHASLAAVSS
jgi:hypothetical protein